MGVHSSVAFSMPEAVLIGGSDIDARLELMRQLRDSFEFSALGSSPALDTRFADEGFHYRAFRLSRRVNPLADLITVAQLLLVLRERRPRVVHTFDTKPSVWGRLAARLAGVPIIIGTLPGLGSL